MEISGYYKTRKYLTNFEKSEKKFSPCLTQANILGLGWAATPAGLKAMEELKNLEEERRAAGGMRDSRHDPAVPKGVASDEMCVFLILNISSLQLIPMNVVAYRSQYGSVNPTAIVGSAILATAVSTLAGVIFCKVMDGKRRV